MTWNRDFEYRDCGWCKTKNITMVRQWGPVNVPVASGGSREWTLLACSRCGGVTAIETMYNNVQPMILSVLPSDDLLLSEVKHLPPQLQKHYDSARNLLQSGHPGPAAVELRKTLEGAAANSGVDTKTIKTLQEMVKELINAGLITPKFSKVLQHVRVVGNQGAHYSDEDVTREDATRAMNFTTQVLRNLFEVPGEIELIESKPEKPRQATKTRPQGA